MPTVDGLSSGIKSNDIIDAFIKADRASTVVIEQRKSTIQTRLDAVKSFNTKLLSHQLDLSSLGRTALYSSRSAASSAPGVLTATASPTAATGTYQFEVKELAKVSQVASIAQASSSIQLGAGTIDIRLGSGGVTSIAIEAGSSSLSGIAQAINVKGIGVTASVVNDVDGPRLLLTASATGDNDICADSTGFTTTLFHSAPSLLDPPDPPGTPTNKIVQDGKDAQINIGTGSGAIQVIQSSNTFREIAQGITLTAVSQGVSTITVSADSKGISEAVKTFVDGYNGLVQFMKENASFDSSSKKSGALFAESDVRNRFNAITQSLLQSVPNRPQSLSTLGAIGITIDRANGKLSIDQAMLDGKLAADPVGVGKLFTNSAVSSDTGIQFGLLSDKTSVRAPFTVAVTQAAAQPLIASTTNLDALTTITTANRNLTVSASGRDYQVSLVVGSYTAADLAKHVQTAFDQAITSQPDKVKVTLSGSRLNLTGNSYGIASTLQVSGTAATALKVGSGKFYGQDVVGTINGIAAVGTGQVLSGAVGSDAEGLRLTVTSMAPIASATLTVSKGLAQQAAERVKAMTDSSSGVLIQKQDSLEKTLTTLTKSITAADERLATRRKRYQAQFLAMEKSINASNSLGAYVTSQVKGFENATANK